MIKTTVKPQSKSAISGDIPNVVTSEWVFVYMKDSGFEKVRVFSDDTRANWEIFRQAKKIERHV